jgi:hypothetical protein
LALRPSGHPFAPLIPGFLLHSVEAQQDVIAGVKTHAGHFSRSFILILKKQKFRWESLVDALVKRN